MFQEKEKKAILKKTHLYQFGFSYVDSDKRYIIMNGTTGNTKRAITYTEDPEDKNKFIFKIVNFPNKNWGHFVCASKNGTNLFASYDKAKHYYRSIGNEHEDISLYLNPLSVYEKPRQIIKENWVPEARNFITSCEGREDSILYT